METSSSLRSTSHADKFWRTARSDVTVGDPRVIADRFLRPTSWLPASKAMSDAPDATFRRFMT